MTTKKTVFVFLFDGFSDWEIAYLSPEINKSESVDLIYFSKDGNPVSSMGGLRVFPDTSLSDIDPTEISMLILPGGTAWEKGENSEIDWLVKSLFEKQKTIAAICAATAYLGEQGLLNNRKHTSNALFYLKAIAPQYAGESYYVDAPAVTDKNLITANGIAAVEFAREVFASLNLFKENDIEKWFQLFKNGIWSE